MQYWSGEAGRLLATVVHRHRHLQTHTVQKISTSFISSPNSTLRLWLKIIIILYNVIYRESPEDLYFIYIGLKVSNAAAIGRACLTSISWVGSTVELCSSSSRLGNPLSLPACQNRMMLSCGLGREGAARFAPFITRSGIPATAVTGLSGGEW